MNSSNNKINLEQIRELDIVVYLASLGYHPDPKQTRNDDYYYISPLHDENTASFHVNRRKNCWYDWGNSPGEKKGGNIIDFAMQYHRCTFIEAISKLSSGMTFNPLYISREILPEEKEGKIKITAELPLKNYALLHYATSRGIPLDIVKANCCQVHYEFKEKNYFGIGFKNDQGGYEIRNKYLKNGNMPKGITTIDNASDKVAVFEGFFDFLSYMTKYQHMPESKYNFVILNSTSFFEYARPFMERHEQIDLYLDQGKGGRRYTEYALSLNDKYKDKSMLYKGHDDFNEWLVNSGKRERKQQSRKVG